jgi:hypothetical protein
LLGWAVHGADLPAAGRLLGDLFGLRGLGSLASLLAVYDRFTLAALGIAGAITLTGTSEAANLPPMRRVGYALLWGLLFLLSLLQLGEPSEFIYVRF